jgi:hypothetical protein
MKLRFKIRGTNNAGVLVLTLLLASILGLTLGSYLYWVRAQNLLVAESQSWNSALAIAEAGIEEGLAQINVNVGSGDVNLATNYAASASANFGVLGENVAGAYGPKYNILNNGSYNVIILPPTQAGAGPTIISTGLTILPIVSRPISRTVQVTTMIKSLLANGITALTNVDLKGNGLTTDSYDSSDLVHFPNGLYNSTNRLAGGDIASLWGVIGIQNANIYGHIETGVNDTNAPTVGSNGRVGDLNWVGSGIEPGWWIKDFNMDVPDVKPPIGANLPFPTSPNKVNGTNFYNLGTGRYYTGDGTSLALGNNDVLDVSGNAVLYVPGDTRGNGLNMNNNAVININNGASLTVYIGSPTGPGVKSSFGMVNTSGNSSTFAIFGLPTLTSLTWGGNTKYLGTVYAPEATFTLGGGGSTDYDFQGAVTVQSIGMNGHFNLHYDQNLRRQAPSSGFTVSSWREL